MSDLLLVEDDRFMSHLLKSALVTAGYNVHTAHDAQSAIDILDEYGAHAVLLDLMLPGHNGIELLQELQSHSDWQRLPVIIMSTHQPERMNLSATQWREYGVRAYFYKPETTPQTVLDKLNELGL